MCLPFHHAGSVGGTALHHKAFSARVKGQRGGTSPSMTNAEPPPP